MKPISRRSIARPGVPLLAGLALVIAGGCLPGIGDDGGCPGKCDHASARDGGAEASIPVEPLGASDFFVLSSGVDLTAFDPEGLLERRTGLGGPFVDEARYLALKSDPRIHWVVRNLETGDILDQSLNADVNLYGASVPKVFVGAALLAGMGEQLPADAWADLMRLIVRSDNSVWTPLEELAGGASAVEAFVDRMGYPTIKGARHGNEVNAVELSEFLLDVHHRRFSGAEALFKIMSACRTGASKSRKYLPVSVVLGGKTGTFREWSHDMRFVEIAGQRHAVVVLTDGSAGSEAVAIMFGGLVREFFGSSL